jgi:SAM-dependent methyltransferase
MAPRTWLRIIARFFPGQSNSVTKKENLQAIAHRRLYPSLTDPNYLVLRARRSIFSNWIRNFAGELKVLDIGGRYQPYRPLLDGRISQYVAVDLIPTEQVNLLASGEALPFPASTFDLVIATQVFDYFSQPFEAARQIHAVLKPSGALLMSVAAIAPRFASEERWRFCPDGIRSLLAPFSELEIVPEVYSPAGIIRSVNLFLDWFLPSRPLKKLYAISGCPLLNLLGLLTERFHISKNDQFTPNYSVFARKNSCCAQRIYTSI